MAYCRFSEGDVYLVRTRDIWECTHCKLNSEANSFFDTLQDVREHLLLHRARDHAVPDHALDRVDDEILDQKVGDAAWLETITPVLKSYKMPDISSDSVRGAFERVLLLVRASSDASTALERTEGEDSASDGISWDCSELTDKLRRLGEVLEALMKNELERLSRLIRKNPTAEGADCLIQLFFSQGLPLSSHEKLLSFLHRLRPEIWEEKLLDRYSSIPVTRAMKETGLLAPLGKPEKFHDKETLRSIFDRWVRELAPAIETAGPRPSPDERLLRAIFGQEPIDHPANLLEELIGAVQKLADSRG